MKHSRRKFKAGHVSLTLGTVHAGTMIQLRRLGEYAVGRGILAFRPLVGADSCIK